MRRIVAPLAFAAALTGAVAAPATAQPDTDLLFAAGSDSGSVLVYDPGTGREVGRVDIGASGVLDAAAARDRGVFLVLDNAAAVDVIDARTMSLTAEVPVPAGASVVAPVHGADGIAVAGTSSFAVVSPSGAVSMSFPDAGRPVDLVVTRDGRFAYVADEEHSVVRVYDLAGRVRAGEIPVDGRIAQLEVGPDGTLYVAKLDRSEITAVEPVSRRTRGLATGAQGVIGGTALSADGGSLHAITANGVVEIDTGSSPTTGVIALTPHAFGLEVGDDESLFFSLRTLPDITALGTGGPQRIPAPAGLFHLGFFPGAPDTEPSSSSRPTPPPGSTSPTSSAPTSSSTSVAPVPTSGDIPSPVAPEPGGELPSSGGGHLAETGVSLGPPLGIGALLLVLGVVAMSLRRGRGRG